MELVIVIIICIISILTLYIVFEINKKKLIQIASDKELDEITKKLPGNRAICEEYLKMLNNKNVKIKEDKSNAKQASLYIALTNTIFIANIKDSFTRIQTIAHECLHSIQNRKILLFNFIFSNIYILYWILVTILTGVKVINNHMLQITILMLLGFVYYFVRSGLETEAMTKAEYLANDYMNKSNILKQDEIDRINKKYSKMNNLGIKTVQYELFKNCIIKVLIYAIIAVFVAY